jgi:hypothetical protein
MAETFIGRAIQQMGDDMPLAANLQAIVAQKIATSCTPNS